MNKQPSEREWGKVAVAAGLAATVFYFFSIVFKPLPVPISRILFFAIGPASVISAVGFFQALRTSARVIPLALGTVLGIVAGAVLTLMAVVQATQFTVLPRRIANAPTEAVQETLTRILWGVNVVQSGLDISWDIFVALSTIFLALALLRHPRFGRILPWLGVLAAASALTLNLSTFPTAPSSAGLVDLGPAVGVWYTIVLIQLWRSLPWLDTGEGDTFSVS